MRRSVGPVAAALLLAAALGACREEEGTPGPERSIPALDLPSDAEREAQDALRAAETFLDAGHGRKAEPLLRKAVELTPRDARALFLLGQCLFEHGSTEEAARYLARAVEIEPRNAAAQDVLAAALKSHGDLAAAEAACRAWTVAVPDDEDSWFQLGTVLYERGELKDAAQALRRAESVRASRADIRSQLGLVHLAMGELEKAEAKQRDAIERKPDYAEAHFRLGDVLSRAGPSRAREAVAAFERAVEIDPRSILGHLYLYRLCRTVGDADAETLRARGEKAWAEVLRLHGRKQLAGQGLLEEGDDGPPEKTSEYALRERVATSPEDPEPRLELARLLHRDRRFDEAADAYRLAIERGAADPRVRARLGAALLAQGDALGAESVLREAAAAAPSDAAPLRLLAWALLVQGRDEECMKTCDAALALAPSETMVFRTRALARMHRGELDAGLQDIANAGWL